MGWMETCAVQERMRFVVAVERQDEPMAALCRRFGVSRRIGYKKMAGPLSRGRDSRAGRALARELCASSSAGWSWLRMW